MSSFRDVRSSGCMLVAFIVADVSGLRQGSMRLARFVSSRSTGRRAEGWESSTRSSRAASFTSMRPQFIPSSSTSCLWLFFAQRWAQRSAPRSGRYYSTPQRITWPGRLFWSGQQRVRRQMTGYGDGRLFTRSDRYCKRFVVHETPADQRHVLVFR